MRINENQSLGFFENQFQTYLGIIKNHQESTENQSLDYIRESMSRLILRIKLARIGENHCKEVGENQ